MFTHAPPSGTKYLRSPIYCNTSGQRILGLIALSMLILTVSSLVWYRYDLWCLAYMKCPQGPCWISVTASVCFHTIKGTLTGAVLWYWLQTPLHSAEICCIVVPLLISYWFHCILIIYMLLMHGHGVFDQTWSNDWQTENVWLASFSILFSHLFHWSLSGNRYILCIEKSLTMAQHFDMPVFTPILQEALRRWVAVNHRVCLRERREQTQQREPHWEPKDCQTCRYSHLLTRSG